MTSQNVLGRYSFNARERHCLFVNGGGSRFIEAGYALGVDLDLEGRGVAVVDLDRDGALDLVVRNVARQKLAYLHNEVGAKQGFLRVALTGTRSNRDAIGAVVRVRAGGLFMTRVKMAGNGFQGQSEGTLAFGLGAAARVDEVEVRWPAGGVERFHDVGANQELRVVEGEGRVQAAPLPNWRPPQATAAPGAAPAPWQAWRLDGTPWRTGARPTLVVLWATWCGPCKKEVPELNAVAAALGRDLDVMALAVDEEADVVAHFAYANGVRYPVGRATRAGLDPLVARAFGDGAITLPTAVLLDARGQARRVFTGGVTVAAVRAALASAR